MPLLGPINRVRLRLEKAWQERAVALKAASFGIIGIFNTAVDFGVWLLAREVFRIPFFLDSFERFADFCQCGAASKLALIPANIVAWSVAVTGSYILNSLITFSVESGRKLRRNAFFNFVASGVAGLIANTATVFLLSYLIPEIAAKVCAIAASFAVNFSLSHFVVFRTRQPRIETSAE